MTVIVIVVSYNGLHWIDKCLQSIRLSTTPVHTIVVDNQSTDGTVAHIIANYPEVQLIQSEKNLGFGQANNIGLQLALAAHADYVLLLNQDAWVAPTMLAQLLKTSHNFPEYWILTPLQCHSIKQTVEPNFQKYVNESNIRITNVKEIEEMQFANAALWLLPRTTIETVGGFDSLFPHYGEDNDYVNRLHYWGGKIGLVASAKGYHDRDTASKPTIEKQIYKATLGIVGQLKDINKSLFINVLNAKYRLIKKTANNLFHSDWIALRVYWTAFLRAVVPIHKIGKHRKLSKEKGAFL
jgi:GT2 family glycosyltransferase